ncbi:hypothetical protein C8K30_113133 [Promicromonospora sp. AC04]|nr:hypothetical protein C8K30_113133 [Promicromonospora sp. AC04]
MESDLADPGNFVLHAWVDESMRRASDGHRGLYLLAAVVADPTSCEPVRDALRELVWKANGRLHWRDETRSRRAKIASAISIQDLAHVVVVAAPVDPRRQ